MVSVAPRRLCHLDAGCQQRPVRSGKHDSCGEPERPVEDGSVRRGKHKHHGAAQHGEEPREQGAQERLRDPRVTLDHVS